MIREDFPILSEKVYNRELVYLDNAATTQKPQSVMDAISYGYSHFNANIHRGIHRLAQLATQEHEAARQTVANFIGTQSKDEIVFTKGTTDSINLLAFSIGEYRLPNGEPYLKEGDEILISSVEHHSNIVPWQMLCERKKTVLKVIPLNAQHTWTIDEAKALISPNTRLIAVSMVSNVLGTILPVEDLIQEAQQHNIPVLIDGAQAVPHIPINVQELDCDFLAFSAHKIYGPTGVGVLYGKQKWLEALPPYQGGGEMIERVTFEHTTYNTLPYKFEAGTPDFIGSYALGKALEYVSSIGMNTLHAHETDLTDYAQQGLQAIEGIRIYAPTLPKAGVLSFNAFYNDRLIHPFDIGTLLDRQGIATRTGHHCAEPLIDLLGVPGTVRISFGLYNTREDVDRFLEALKKALMMLQ